MIGIESRLQRIETELATKYRRKSKPPSVMHAPISAARRAWFADSLATHADIPKKPLAGREMAAQSIPMHQRPRVMVVTTWESAEAWENDLTAYMAKLTGTFGAPDDAQDEANKAERLKPQAFDAANAEVEATTKHRKDLKAKLEELRNRSRKT